MTKQELRALALETAARTRVCSTTKLSELQIMGALEQAYEAGLEEAALIAEHAAIGDDSGRYPKITYHCDCGDDCREIAKAIRAAKDQSEGK